MVRRSGLRGSEREAAEDEAADHDISVFPLAIPLIAGPGAMTSVVLRRGRAGDDPAALLAAAGMTRLLGRTGTDVIGRVLGVARAALAAQIALDGVRGFLNA